MVLDVLDGHVDPGDQVVLDVLDAHVDHGDQVVLDALDAHVDHSLWKLCSHTKMFGRRYTNLVGWWTGLKILTKNKP